MPYKILIVDDQADDLSVTKLILSDEPDFEATGLLDADEAIQLVRENPTQYPVILLDYKMPKDGLQTAKEMLVINPDLVIAIFSSDQSRDTLKKCIDSGVSDFIDKAESEESVLAKIHSLCEKWERKAKVFIPSQTITTEQELISSIGIVGCSSAMATVAKYVHRAARVDSTVLIQGESGSGKEMIANAIHKLSKRKNGSFVAINVNAITENLVESELFGHVKGAFTGAINKKDGLFVAADGGTIFLDEIGDLKPELQVKLLRVLQERKVYPVGSTRPVDIDVRVIVATHVNLENAIKTGAFREDLYYRIQVFPITVPPLRERPADIQPLIAHFLKHFGCKAQVLMKTIRCLEQYSWPGNVRELQNEIERQVALGTKTIHPEDLSTKIQSALNIRTISESKTEEPRHAAVQLEIYEKELKYLEDNIEKAGSIRKACASVFKSTYSSIYSRVTFLKNELKRLNKVLQDDQKANDSFEEETYEASIN